MNLIFQLRQFEEKSLIIKQVRNSDHCKNSKCLYTKSSDLMVLWLTNQQIETSKIHCNICSSWFWFIIFLTTSIVNFIFYFDSMASIQSTYSTNSRHSSATAWKEYYRSQFPTSYTVLVILQINIVILFVKYSGYLSMWLLWYRDIDYINRMLVENKSSFFCKTELGLVQFGHFCLLKTFI